MKKMLVLAFGLLLLCGLNAWPQDSAGAKADTMSQPSAKGKLMSLRGTVSDDGKSFTNDKDQKSWTIQNAEIVKGHEGHHVQLRAHVYADKSEIHVMSVKMLSQAKEAPKP